MAKITHAVKQWVLWCPLRKEHITNTTYRAAVGGRDRSIAQVLASVSVAVLSEESVQTL